jgi:DNA-directed RNA polymerase specialized sigma24 family protein
VIDRKRQSQTLKAGCGDVRGESAFGSHSSSGTALGIDVVQGESPTPEWIAMMEEECQGLFGLLPDEELQSIACFRLEGYSNTEIASKIGKSVATVERRLREIRECWKTSIENPNQDSRDD